jgi:hypothetical protein
MSHVAFKCTYNNGEEGSFVGFNGVCSDEIIKLNIEDRHVWCNTEKCECKVYYDSGFKGKRPILGPCYESKLFTNWKYGTGCNGMDYSKIGIGGIAVLTTRFPNESEGDRRIIGLYKIVNNLKEGLDTYLYGSRSFGIRLPLEEARELYFWDYHHNDSKPENALWGTGLVRYLSDSAVAKILDDLQKTMRDEDAKCIVTKLQHDFTGVDISTVYGPHKREIPRLKQLLIGRKYGGGGEGEEHRKLKEYIRSHPEAIGLSSVKSGELEHTFISGDVVDILFEHRDGSYSVVEIETTDPLPGCYQAIKYRALQCAEMRLPLDSTKVRAVVVAHSIPSDLGKFCQSYGIHFYEVCLG